MSEMRIIYLPEFCVHCGACVKACQMEAIVQDPETRAVSFENKYLCINCCQCVYACKFNAMIIKDQYDFDMEKI